MNRLLALFQKGLRDRVFLLNLILRLAVFSWVLTRGSALQGDSEYYLASMRSIWSGEWGGATFRAPAFAWYLAALGGPILALLLQTLAVWLVGVDLAQRSKRLVGILWIFDPVLFYYSHLIMSDALFAVALYVSVLVFLRFLGEPNLKSIATLGFVLALSMLIRPIGLPFAVLTLGFAAFPFSMRRIRQLGIAVLIVVALIFPRLYWNSQHQAGWTIASQGRAFQISVAAAVEYAGQGMGYTAAETRWYESHPDAADRVRAARETLLEKWPTWFVLSAKGMARTLVGHANIEVASMVLGRPIVGPGWFSEGRESVGWSLMERALWIFGILFTLVYVVVEAVILVPRLPRRDGQARMFSAWILLALAGFIVAPQLYGDCRFRLPIIALLFAAAVYEKARMPRETEKLRSS